MVNVKTPQQDVSALSHWFGRLRQSSKLYLVAVGGKRSRGNVTNGPSNHIKADTQVFGHCIRSDCGQYVTLTILITNVSMHRR